MKGRVVVEHRIDQLEAGNIGDHRFSQAWVWELKIDLDPGYRLHYAMEGKTVVLLLCGGSTRTQEADVKEAVTNWATTSGGSHDPQIKISNIPQP